MFDRRGEGEYKDDEYVEKVLSRMTCAYVNGASEIPANYFHKSGNFSFITDKAFKGVTFKIQHNQPISLNPDKIRTERAGMTGSVAPGAGAPTYIYSLDLKGLIISSSDIKKVKAVKERIFVQNKDKVRADSRERFSKLWKELKGRKIGEKETEQLREILNCGGAGIDSLNIVIENLQRI